jgi:hypothetical protein
VLTYARDIEVSCAAQLGLVDWTVQRTGLLGDELYFIIDQINALDTDPEWLESAPADDGRRYAKPITNLEGSYPETSTQRTAEGEGFPMM